MIIAQEFFKEVLRHHYDQDYNEIITQFAEEKELIAYRMREPTDDTELENLKKLSKVHSLGALLSAMTYLERISIAFGKKNWARRRTSKAPSLAYDFTKILRKIWCCCV